MRRQAADICQRVDLDPQQLQASVVDRHFKGHARQTQETGGIGSAKKAVDEGGLDFVEIGLRRRRARRAVRLVWRLPLSRGTRGVRMVVPGTMQRMTITMMVMVVRLIMMMFMTPVMIVRVMVMAVLMMTHGVSQYATGLLMIDL